MVNTALGLRLQVQLVPVMQLFVTLDQAAQGQVQGECPPGSPRQGAAASWTPPNHVLALRALRELQRPGK